MFLERIKLCTEYGYLKNKNYFYKKINVLAKGGFLSVNLSGIALNHIIKEAITTTNNTPKVLNNYTDDLFLMIKKGKLPVLLNTLNSIHPKINFTH